MTTTDARKRAAENQRPVEDPTTRVMDERSDCCAHVPVLRSHLADANAEVARMKDIYRGHELRADAAEAELDRLRVEVLTFADLLRKGTGFDLNPTRPTGTHATAAETFLLEYIGRIDEWVREQGRRLVALVDEVSPSDG